MTIHLHGVGDALGGSAQAADWVRGRIASLSANSGGLPLHLAARQHYIRSTARAHAHELGLGDSKSDRTKKIDLLDALGNRMSSAGLSPTGGTGDAQYFSQDLRGDLGAAIPTPKTPLEISAFLMSRQVDPALETYRQRGYDVTNPGWAPYRGASTNIPVFSHTKSEGSGDLHVFVASVFEGWRQSAQAAFSGFDASAADREAMMRGAMEFQENLRLHGVSGLSGASLLGTDSKAVAMQRYSSDVVIGGDTSTDDMLAAIGRAVEATEEASEGRFSPTRAMISKRFVNRFGRKFNRANGASGSAAEALRSIFSDHGINELVLSKKSLRGIDGEKRDGILFTGDDPTTGLAAIEGMDVAPIGEINTGHGIQTIYAIVVGGLENPYNESALLADFEIGA